MQQGWISLHRKMLYSNIFQNEKLLKVFIYCLLKATHTDHELQVGRQTVRLKPGQFVFGRKKAAIELEMKESTIRDYMKILEDDKTIDIKSTNKFSLVTIVNWELYQPLNFNSDNKSDSKRTAKGQQINTNNNGNKGNNDNKNNYYVEIIDFLNQHAETNFKSSTKKTKELINARLAEGFTLEDFKTVIEYCSKEWKGKVFGNGELGDSYLRPSTLFNNKFDERLNKAKLGSTQTPQQEQASNYKPIKIDMTRGED